MQADEIDEAEVKRNLARKLHGVREEDIQIIVRPVSSGRRRGLADADGGLEVFVKVLTQHDFVAAAATGALSTLDTDDGLFGEGVEVRVAIAPVSVQIAVDAPLPPPLPPQRPSDYWSNEYGVSPGAILVNGGRVLIDKVNLTGYDSQRGGAIAILQGDVLIRDSFFSDNHAMEGGPSTWQTRRLRRTHHRTNQPSSPSRIAR